MTLPHERFLAEVRAAGVEVTEPEYTRVRVDFDRGDRGLRVHLDSDGYLEVERAEHSELVETNHSSPDAGRQDAIETFARAWRWLQEG